MKAHPVMLAALLVAALHGAPSRPLAQPAPPPEASTGTSPRALGQAAHFMVAAANPLAAEAGRAMLRAGGSAVDAAIAVQLVLNLVEPQSSGIGGGAFLVHFDPATKTVATLDGRETAPAAAGPDLFLNADGKPLGFMEALVGGRSVGVPGTIRLLEEAHRKWGKLPWEKLFEPALTLATEGFAVSPRLHGLLAQETALRGNPRARAYFYAPDGSPWPVGHILKNPAFAATLRFLAQTGADGFYLGPPADDVVASVVSQANPGRMTLADLAAYKVEARAPVCGVYRTYRICGMGPPSSGAIAVLQSLALVEAHDLARTGPGPEAGHLLAEAQKLAFADRALYVADPAFVDVPAAGLLDADYLKSRAALIDPLKAMGRAEAGAPPMKRTHLYAPSDGIEHGTSHISIVDGNGGAVAMTTTIESGFGARVMTRGGYLLNNELTDFSFVPRDRGKPVANRVEPGKRPRSSMAPTLVFRPDGKLFAVLGSPGGSQIIAYVVKTLVALIDWKMDPQRAVDFGNFGNRNGPTELEKGSETQAWRGDLEARGHEVRLMEMTSGAQAIVVTPSGLDGGADFRREGVAIGD